MWLWTSTSRFWVAMAYISAEYVSSSGVLCPPLEHGRWLRQQLSCCTFTAKGFQYPESSPTLVCKVLSDSGFNLYVPDGLLCWASFSCVNGCLSSLKSVQILCLILRCAICSSVVIKPEVFQYLTWEFHVLVLEEEDEGVLCCPRSHWPGLSRGGQESAMICCWAETKHCFLPLRFQSAWVIHRSHRKLGGRRVFILRVRSLWHHDWDNCASCWHV